MKDKRLKKDIVVPKGTIFQNYDGTTVKFKKDNYECGVGITKDSAGMLVYGIDPHDKDLEGWFEDV